MGAAFVVVVGWQVGSTSFFFFVAAVRSDRSGGDSGAVVLPCGRPCKRVRRFAVRESENIVDYVAEPYSGLDYKEANENRTCQRRKSSSSSS
jgi:hypothetical protein